MSRRRKNAGRPIDIDAWPVTVPASLLGELVDLAGQGPRNPLTRLVISAAGKHLRQALGSMRAELNRRVQKTLIKMRPLMAYLWAATPEAMRETVMSEWFPDVSFERIRLEVEIFHRSRGQGPSVGPIE